MNSTLLLAVLISFPAFAKGKLEAEVVNSPIKESHLKVQLHGVDSASKVLFKPKNGGEEVEGEVVQESGVLLGKFKTSHLPVGSYEYRVRVTTASGNSGNNNAKSVDFVKFSIDPSLEVADPGEEGMKTLAGIDSDKDGVRDDIQRWLNENYSSKESTKKALKQMAVAMNKRLSANTKEESIEQTYEIGYAISCLAWIDDEWSMDQETKLRREFYNTSLRIKKKLEASSYFHGKGDGPRELNLSPNQWNQLCNFQASKKS